MPHDSTTDWCRWNLTTILEHDSLSIFSVWRIKRNSQDTKDAEGNQTSIQVFHDDLLSVYTISKIKYMSIDCSAGREFRSLHDQYPVWIFYFISFIKNAQTGFEPYTEAKLLASSASQI
ncbi:MAG: hypothetical protein HQ402_00740 [Parcubacteria group bacterium]|nr:hypothetical protein [Parcubacteria group bacterium]